MSDEVGKWGVKPWERDDLDLFRRKVASREFETFTAAEARALLQLLEPRLAAPEGHTPRGFATYATFTDSYGAEVRVQRSSSASGRRCWVFVSGGSTLSPRQKALSEESPEQPGDRIVNDHTAAHLTPAQARKLAEALLYFADVET